jgi:hypothetical protein
MNWYSISPDNAADVAATFRIMRQLNISYTYTGDQVYLAKLSADAALCLQLALPGSVVVECVLNQSHRLLQMLDRQLDQK